MDPVSFPASVLMTHCNPPKTWRSAITTQQEHRYNHISISAQSSSSQTIYHYVFPFTPVYFSISTLTSLPTNDTVDLLMLQIDWSHPPSSFPDVGHVCRGEPHPSWNDCAGEPCYRTWLYLLDTVVAVFLFQSDCPTISNSHLLPSQWLAASLYLHTLHQQDTSSVDVPTFAVAIWQILPRNEKYIYSTCFCWHSTSEIRCLSTLERHISTGRNLQYKLTYDLGCRNRMAKVQIPTNRPSQRGWQ